MWKCAGDYRGHSLSGLFAYIGANIKLYDQERLFRSYVCDSLQAIGKASGGYVQSRYIDLITPQQTIENPNEYVKSIVKKLGVKVV